MWVVLRVLFFLYGFLFKCVWVDSFLKSIFENYYSKFNFKNGDGFKGKV